MPEVKIEALSFLPEEIELIEFRQNNEIRIHLSDKTLQKKRQYEK